MRFYLRSFLYAVAFMLVAACNQDEELLTVQEQWEQYTTANDLPSNFILDIAEDDDGRVWIATSEGVAVLEDGDFEVFTTADGLNDNFINAIAIDVDGHVWAGNEGGLNIYQNGNWDDFGGTPVTFLLKAKNSDMWIATNGIGIYKYDWSDEEFIQYYDNVCTACNGINTIHQDKNEVLWFGSNADLKTLDNNTWNSFTVADGLPGEVIWAIGSDGWGNVWIGSQDGTTLSRYKDGDFETIPIGNMAGQNWIYDIEEDRQGIIWFTSITDNPATDGLYTFDGVFVKRVNEGLPIARYSALLPDSNGNLWMGTVQEGLIYYYIKN